MKNPGSRKIICAVFFGLLIVLSWHYLDTCFLKAQAKDFDSDESKTFQQNISQDNIPDIVLHGVRDQGSAAPLDYVLMVLWHKVRPYVNSFGLPFNVYYRLNAILISLISGLVLVVAFYRRFKFRTKENFILSLQLGTLLLAIGFYYFWYFNIYFATQMRAYALWNALWFMVLASVMLSGELRRISSVLLTLLAAVSTASVFQIFALATNHALVRIFSRESLKETAIQTLKIFTLPLAVSFYYIFLSQSYAYGEAERYHSEFWNFWIRKEMVPVLSVIGIGTSVYLKKLQSHIIVFSTMLVLFLISPLINFMVISKGFYFSSRQYLYYDLIYPLFLLHLAVILPTGWERLRRLKKA